MLTSFTILMFTNSVCGPVQRANTHHLSIEHDCKQLPVSKTYVHGKLKCDKQATQTDTNNSLIVALSNMQSNCT